MMKLVEAETAPTTSRPPFLKVPLVADAALILTVAAVALIECAEDERRSSL